MFNVNDNMPKLDGICEKQLFGLQVDKEDDTIFFNDKNHEYRDKQDGSKYISVTQIVHMYQQPFDENF